MTQVSLEEVFNQAAAHYQSGRLDVARQLCEAILAQVPDHSETLHLLGVIAHQTGNPSQGETLIRRAISVRPDAPLFYLNLTMSLLGQGKTAEAERVSRQMVSLFPNQASSWNCLGGVMAQQRNYAEAAEHYRQAIRLNPDYVEAHTNLGTLFNQLGRFQESLEAYEKADSIRPNQPDILMCIGLMLSKVGRNDEAIDAYRRGLALAPSTAWAANNVGNLLLSKGRLPEALEMFDQAISLNPTFKEAYNNKGMALELMGRAKESIEPFQKAVEMAPDSALIRVNLGNAYLRDNRLDDAIGVYQKAIDLDPNYGMAYYNMGTVLKEFGLLDKALASYRKSIELLPRDASAHSNLIYVLHFSPEIDLASLLSEHRLWNQTHAAPLKNRKTAWLCDKNPDRPLRVGFVSPDFRLHPVGRFIKPLLKHLDPSKIQTVCYSDVFNADGLTAEIQRCAGEWRPIMGMDNNSLAGQIQSDQIDILVDLTMHMAGNRMMLFALKPAPVQITWLAYCSTTGLDAMDYRISDPHMDPPGKWERFYTEKTLRLSNSYWCYEPPVEAADLEISPLPALSSGVFTFSCLNNISKINDAVLDAMCAILKGAKGSRLYLHLRPGKAQSVMLERFARRGIDASRILFASLVPLKEYLMLHNQIDLALDPFPYNGGTTSCDAMWMGVPVVTLAGDRPLGRAGVSLLTNLKLESLIAKDAEEYVRLAVNAAGRLDELSALRKTMRQRMLQSPLMDAAGFAREFEALLRRAWHEYVGGV